MIANGGLRKFHDLGDLGCIEVVHLLEDENGPLPWREFPRQAQKDALDFLLAQVLERQGPSPSSRKKSKPIRQTFFENAF